jgi:hypothetical protein
VFFVLSGFVLRLSLTNKWIQPVPNIAAGFAVARLFRLYPVVIATSLLDVSINGALWTVQVEVFGSALVLCAFILERLTSAWLVVGLTAALRPFSFLGHSFVLGRPVLALLYPFCSATSWLRDRRSQRGSRLEATCCCSSRSPFSIWRAQSVMS